MKVLLAVDGSAPALEAVRHALRLVAAGLKASLVLVNVQERASLYEVVTVHDAEAIEQLRSAAGADLLQAAETLVEAAGIDYESEVTSGDPAHQLVELIESYACAAVIMGARGAGRPAGGDLGAVAHSLLKHSPVPVTVVRLPPFPDAEAAADDA